MSSCDVSIIIVNYKTPQLLFECIQSVFKHSEGFTFEIIVIDNQSEDESEELITSNFPSVIWKNMGRNAGFGAANNVGIKAAKGEYVLLLNSDTELYENCIYKSLVYYKNLEKHKRIGLLGCRIEHRDFSLQPSCNYYWAGIREALEANPIVIVVWQRWLKQKKLRDIDKYEKLNTNHEITWLGVPFALINSSIIKENLFDEHFFMYSEDEELNYRLSQKGYKPQFFYETGIFHIIGGSGKDNEKRNRQIFVSKLLFILKSRGAFYFKIYILITRINLYLDKKLSKKNYDIERFWLTKYSKNILLLSKNKSFVLNTYSDK